MHSLNRITTQPGAGTKGLLSPLRVKPHYRGSDLDWAVYGPVHPVDKGDYAPIASGLSKERAYQFVHCVNNFDAVTEALRRVVDYWTAAECDPTQHLGADECALLDELRGVLKAADGRAEK